MLSEHLFQLSQFVCQIALEMSNNRIKFIPAILRKPRSGQTNFFKNQLSFVGCFCFLEDSWNMMKLSSYEDFQGPRRLEPPSGLGNLIIIII